MLYHTQIQFDSVLHSTLTLWLLDFHFLHISSSLFFFLLCLLLIQFLLPDCPYTGDSPDVSASSKPSQTSQGSEASEEGSQGTQGSQATQGSQSTQPLSQFRGCKMSDRVRAVAFLTLG